MHDWEVSSLLPWCLIVTLSLLCTVNGEICAVAQKRCMSRQGCSLALQNYMMSCGPLIHGETNKCSRDCKNALISLLSSQDQEGLNFMTCECDNEQICVTQKQRIQVCSQDVLREMERVKDENTQIECSLAKMICMFDTTCKEALRFYSDYCGLMWRGVRCTSRCNNSLNILYRQTKAQKLKNCICDGSEGYACQAIHDNTQRLCLKRRIKTKTERDSYNVTNKSNITVNKPCPAPNTSTHASSSSYCRSTFTLMLALLLWILSIL